MRPERVETLADVKTWIADHDGRIDAYWDAQHALNSDNEERFKALDTRLTSMEKRVIGFSGAAAGIGALVGTLISVWLRLGG